MAEKCHLKWNEYVSLSTVAFYYEFFHGREGLNRFLRDQIADETIEPSATMERLMEVIAVLEGMKRDVLVVTTNYDQHFERAYEKAFDKKPGVIVYNGGTDANDDRAVLHSGLNRNPMTWRPKGGGTYLYKMHGCISQAKGRNLVITEEDYVNFLSNALSDHPTKRLPLYLLGRLSDSSVLFIGYSLADWNFRVIFKATAEKASQSEVAQNESYAVQFFTPAAFKDPKENEFNEVRWTSLGDFWELDEHTHSTSPLVIIPLLN